MEISNNRSELLSVPLELIDAHTKPGLPYPKEIDTWLSIHRRNHTFEPPETPISSKNYTLNFLWLNKINQSESKGSFLPPNICKLMKIWAALDHPVSIWYDSKSSSKASVQATQSTIGDRSIQFNDIQSLEIVKKNGQLFKDFIPIYIRVDLLKIIIGYELLKSTNTMCTSALNKLVGRCFKRFNRPEYCVILDLTTIPIHKNQLFSQRVFNHLKTPTFVMGTSIDDLLTRYENQLLIMKRSHRNVVMGIKHCIIDPAIVEITRSIKNYTESTLRSDLIYIKYFSPYVSALRLKGPSGVRVFIPESQLGYNQCDACKSLKKTLFLDSPIRKSRLEEESENHMTIDLNKSPPLVTPISSSSSVQKRVGQGVFG